MSKDNSAPAGKREFTVFCVDKNASGGTTWIGAATATSAQEAARLGRTECAEDWGYEEDDVRVLGVAGGDVDILFWDDENCVIE